MRDRLGILPRFWAVFLSALLPLVLIAGASSAAPTGPRAEASWKKASDPLQFVAIRIERGEVKFSPAAKTPKVPWLWWNSSVRGFPGRRLALVRPAGSPPASPVLERSAWVGVVELRI